MLETPYRRSSLTTSESQRATTAQTPVMAALRREMKVALHFIRDFSFRYFGVRGRRNTLPAVMMVGPSSSSGREIGILLIRQDCAVLLATDRRSHVLSIIYRVIENGKTEYTFVLDKKKVIIKIFLSGLFDAGL